jgi:protein-S-isoprenylcysteine O-methyltransferase Ste14
VHARLAELIWFIGAAGWFVIRLPHQRRARKVTVARSAGGRRDRRLLAISLTGLGIIPIIYLVASLIAGAGQLPADRAFAPAGGWIGLVLVVAALALFDATHRQLGRFWSVTLDTRVEHRLIDSGVYSRVRHPMYAAFWLLALSQAVLIPNWIAGLSGIVGFGTLFFARIGREEALMVETFGDRYRDYMRRTARVIPWIY